MNATTRFVDGVPVRVGRIAVLACAPPNVGVIIGKYGTETCFGTTFTLLISFIACELDDTVELYCITWLFASKAFDERTDLGQ